MAKFPELRGRGLLVTRIGAKTDFSEVRVYWASSDPDSGNITERELNSSCFIIMFRAGLGPEFEPQDRA